MCLLHMIAMRIKLVNEYKSEQWLALYNHSINVIKSYYYKDSKLGLNQDETFENIEINAAPSHSP